MPQQADDLSLVVWTREPQDETEAEGPVTINDNSTEASQLTIGDFGVDGLPKEKTSARERVLGQTSEYLARLWNKITKKLIAEVITKLLSAWEYLESAIAAKAGGKLKIDACRNRFARLCKPFEWHSRSLEDILLFAVQTPQGLAPSGLGVIVCKMMILRPDLLRLVKSAAADGTPPAEFRWSGDSIAKGAPSMDSLESGGTYVFRPPKAKLSDLLETPGLTQNDIKLLRLLYGSSNEKMAPHYVGHTEDSGAGRWSGHSLRGVNRFQRVLHKVFPLKRFQRYGPFARDPNETAVVGFAREAATNILSDATVRGVGANVNMFDSVRCMQIISAGEVEQLFKEAQRSLTEDAGVAYLIGPENLSSEILAKDPFWSRLPFSKFGIAALTAYMILVGHARPHLFKRFSALYPLPSTAFPGSAHKNFRTEEEREAMVGRKELKEQFSAYRLASGWSQKEIKHSASSRLERVMDDAAQVDKVMAEAAASASKRSASDSQDKTPAALADRINTIRNARARNTSGTEPVPPAAKRPKKSARDV